MLRVVRKITRKTNQHGVVQLSVNLPAALVGAWDGVTEIQFEINPKTPERATIKAVR